MTTTIGRKRCSTEGCTQPAVVRVQPFKKPTWDFFCSDHWIMLALNTVREAHEAGYLSIKNDETHLTLVDSPTNTLV